MIEAGTSLQQHVVVNTSPSNTFNVPSPHILQSPMLELDHSVPKVVGKAPYAITQTKKFGGITFEKSVIPADRMYHYNGRQGKDGNNKDIIEAGPAQGGFDRAGSSIIGQYLK